MEILLGCLIISVVLMLVFAILWLGERKWRKLYEKLYWELVAKGKVDPTGGGKRCPTCGGYGWTRLHKETCGYGD